VIGVCFQGLTDEYILRLKAAFEKRAEELGYNYLFSDGQMNARIQVSQVENYIQQEVDCIVLNPVSLSECAPAVSAANDAGIPIITLISTTDNQADCTAYVGSDSYESGVIQAKMAIDDLGGQGDVVLLLGQMGHEAQIGRYKGVRDTIEGTGIQIVAMQSADWSRERGYSIIEYWIKANKSFDAILSQNDAMALGAISALREQNLISQVKVYGIDGQHDALISLVSGDLTGSVLQDAEEQGRQCAEVALVTAMGKPVERTYIIPYRPLRKHDAAQYLAGK
jgi:inositol transport system substrate-binding protein